MLFHDKQKAESMQGSLKYSAALKTEENSRRCIFLMRRLLRALFSTERDSLEAIAAAASTKPSGPHCGEGGACPRRCSCYFCPKAAVACIRPESWPHSKWSRPNFLQNVEFSENIILLIEEPCSRATTRKQREIILQRVKHEHITLKFQFQSRESSF